MMKPTHRKWLWLWAALVSAMVVIWAIPAMASGEEEYPLSLELIWETPEREEPVFAEGFPPPEIKAAFEERDIPDEDKEWVLNNIRLWATRKTKKLWLDDGTTMDIPVVEPGEKVRTFTVFPSRNKKYWLVRAMRFEGPEIPPKPEYPGSLTVEFTEAYGYYKGTITLQKAHWREVFMDVGGRIYWEKEFGPYDTHLEDSWRGDIAAYVSDDGEMVLKTTRRRAWFCSRDGTCIEREGWFKRTALSSDGSTFVVHTGSRFSNECGLCAFDNLGERKWCSETVVGGAPTTEVLAIGAKSEVSAFSVSEPLQGQSRKRPLYLVDQTGIILGRHAISGEAPMNATFCNGDSIAILVFARSVLGVDTATGHELWRYEAEEAWKWSFSGGAGSQTVVLISASGDRRATPSKGEVFVLSSNGTLLCHSKWPLGRISMSPCGALFASRTGQGLFIGAFSRN